MIVTATGHRPLQRDRKSGEWTSKLTTPSLPEAMSRELFDRLVALASAWITGQPTAHIFRVGLAQGWDLAVGLAAQKCGRVVVAYVPHNDHGDWRSFYADVHAQVLAGAGDIYDPDVPYSREALLQRNKDMLVGADMVLALWDGSPGGTGHCVGEAKKLNIPVTNLWSSWRKYA